MRSVTTLFGVTDHYISVERKPTHIRISSIHNPERNNGRTYHVHSVSFLAINVIEAPATAIFLLQAATRNCESSDYIIGGSRGGVRDARPPLGIQILSISCSFRENLACSRPPGGFTPPPSGKSWIRHCT